MAIKVSKQLNRALKDYKQVIENTYNTGGSSNSYCTYIRAVENEMQQKVPSFNLLNNWILPQIGIKDVDSIWNLLENVLNEFDGAFDVKITHIKKHPKSKCRSALASFTKYVLGQYKADLYLSLEQKSDFESCRIIARNALFCSIEVANGVKNGDYGSQSNKGKGNPYYSWFCCGFQRQKVNQERRKECPISKGIPDPQGTGTFILDDNQKAGLAIKGAVKIGFPNWMKVTDTKFEDYMACHIWDKSCYDYRYHTSVFNLVLLPKSIGGLSDYNQKVKELLQYEAAMRFGVYPGGKDPDGNDYKFKMSKDTKKIYEELHNEWRQPCEHEKARENAKNKSIPKPI